MRFSELGIIPNILKAIDEAGYLEPTPIQKQAIPPVLAGRDLLGCAQTGTGKTAAFSIPILQRLSKEPSPAVRALILTPTRELALQIYENICQYARYTPVTAAVIFGGVSQVPQVEALRAGADILIATPGRLWDLMGQKFVTLDRIEEFVLDEADRMLDMGFIHDVKRIINFLPERRQTLLFSATMPAEIVSLAESLLHNPVRVAITPTATPVELINQQVVFVEKLAKRELLKTILRQKGSPQTLVFTRTKHGADRVARDLTRMGVSARALHGDKSQGARQAALRDFKENKVAVLVATDIAARGLDISELPLVINFELPNIPDTYVHRIGRTGRAGQAGTAISFCDSVEREYLADIEKLIQRKIPVLEVPCEQMPQAPAATAVNLTTAVRSVKPNRGRTPGEHAGGPSNLQKQPRKRLASAAVKQHEKGTKEKDAVQEQPTRSQPPQRNSTSAAIDRGENMFKRGGTPNNSRRRKKRVEDDFRVDIASPVNTARISEETAARIRAKVAAKLQERVVAKQVVNVMPKTGELPKNNRRRRRSYKNN